MRLTVPEILEELRLNRGSFPRAAVEAAIDRRDEMVPELLRILDEAADRPQELLAEAAATSHLYALYLLAYFREPAACPRIIRFFRLPGTVALDASGDVVSEDLGRILASVSHGDVRPIQELIEDREGDEWVRGAGVQALVEMVLSDQLPRAEAVAYFGKLFAGGLEEEHSHVWNALASAATELHPEELVAPLWRAFENGSIDPFYITPEEIEEALHEPREVVLERARQHSKGLVGNTVDEMSWWACFDESSFDESSYRHQKRLAAPPTPGWLPAETVRRTEPKVGRNSPCPCGSGKKYKKCCGARAGA